MNEHQVPSRHRLRLAATAIVGVIALGAVLTGCSSSSDSATTTAPSSSGRPGTSAQPVGTHRPLHVVVLGDSYSAGNSAGSYEGPAECFRSPYNYGHDVAQDLGRRTGRKVVVDTQACSGATSKDVLEPSNGRPAQVDAVDAQTDVVFLTIGGNDVDFAGIVLSCLIGRNQGGGASFDAAGCDTKLAKAQKAVDDGTFKRHLEQVLTSIAAHGSPSTKVVVVGYPYLEGDTTLTGTGRDGTVVQIGSRLRALQDSGTVVQARAVADADHELGRDQITYVPTASALAGHELHAGGDYEAQAKDQNVWIQAPTPSVEALVWYHPGVRAHREVADGIILSGALDHVG